MPDQETWSGFFGPDRALRALGLTSDRSNVVDFGCGYGTFAIPAARIVQATVYALDIDPEMVTTTASKARAAGLDNVQVIRRDFLAGGTGLGDVSVDYAMLFNILHTEHPQALLQEAYRVLRPGGLLAIMHWNYDPSTPRGPSMAIRPRPEQCREWSESVGFVSTSSTAIDLPPYHYGLSLRRPP